MSVIPRHLIEKDKEGVENVTYYGVPALELDRDELLAALNVTKKQSEASFEAFTDFRDFVRATRI